jgi:hypothetical protein
VFGLAVFLVLLISCTYFPEAKRMLGFNDTISVRDGDKKVDLDKALIVDACNADKTICLKDVILIKGRLDEGTINSIKNLKGPNNKTICLDSRGGNIDIATNIGSWIKANNYNTCLAEKYVIKEKGTISSTVCHSACPFILAMGNERTMVGENFKIGIHHSGGTLDLCFCSFDFNAFAFIATDKYEEMLSLSNASEQHQNMLNDSLKIDFSDNQVLSQLEIDKYKLFTQKI